MQQTTHSKYQTRARNFYRKHIGTDNPSSAQICAALVSGAQNYRPNSFRTLRHALSCDQLARGNSAAAKQVAMQVNPVTAKGSELPRKPKPKRVHSVPHEDFKALQNHLLHNEHNDEIAAIVLAKYLGTRPCEMRTITLDGNVVHIIGGKKTSKGDRGADRSLVIEHPKLLRLIRWSAKRMAKCERSNAAIRDRLRLECRKLWPRRKRHPTLYSFRHQLGSNLKASGEDAKTLAYIMGHQSIKSIEVYGDRRSGEGHRVHVRPAADADFSKIRQPTSPACYGRERVIGEIAFPQPFAPIRAVNTNSAPVIKRH